MKITEPVGSPTRMKVPQIGWSGVRRYTTTPDPWDATPFAGMADGEPMYFVHSYVVVPEDASTRLARTAYGEFEFCSAVRLGNVFACQFHPERSGPHGLAIYRRLGEQAAARSGRTLAPVDAAGTVTRS